MIPIYRMNVIQIEITNACNLRCANCTRFVGHHQKPFFMSVVEVKKAIRSLESFPGTIGIMGGEPTVHPKFKEICKAVRELVPDRRKRQLWTNGCKWQEYKEDIEKTFDTDLVVYNDHSDKTTGAHQPLLIAAKDILEDKELMWRLIGNCWVQWRWAASITPKGGFFCEVAAAQDMLFNGSGGYAIKKNWWNKNPNEFFDQVKQYCPNCSAAIPLPSISSHKEYDLVSKSNLERFEKFSPKILKGNFKLIEKKYSEKEIEKIIKKGWTPWSHRPYKQSAPEKKWA